MSIIEYATLQYHPSLISGEVINIGIIIYDKAARLTKFYSTRKLTRVKTFDDQLDINVVKDLLADIKDEIEANNTQNLLTDFNLSAYIHHFNNEFRFIGPMSIETDDNAEAVSLLQKKLNLH